MAVPWNKKYVLVSVVSSALLAALWLFPRFWYTQTTVGEKTFWFAESTNLANWKWEEIPVGKSAEKMLVADRMVNGEFVSQNGKTVRVFSAKRYQEKQNEVGLFVHTPDRCWVQAGWKIDPVEQDVLTLEVHGLKIPFERRLFDGDGNKELVYFAGLTGGQPLLYRLDHNLSVSQRFIENSLQKSQGAALRASDKRLWTRVWDSFTHRRQLFGPKQFLRISTPVEHGNMEAADKLLQEFVSQWLTPADFKEESANWHQVAAK
jgi:hypothetical protein